MSKGTWERGVRERSFKNLGTMKKKKRGKLPPRPRGLREGIHKIRMAKR